MKVHPRQKLIIAGAGIAGMTLALALAQGAGDCCKIMICDPQAHTRNKSGRATAIAAGPRRMLEALGVWNHVARSAQPISRMVITDSQQNDAVRPAYLQFGGDIAPGEAFAHMVEDDSLLSALLEMVLQKDIALSKHSLTAVKLTEAGADVTASDGDPLHAALLIAADGGRSRLRTGAGLPVVGWSYRQAGIVATLSHELPHDGQAEEHFLPAGPFAVLPLSGNRISIVWTLAASEAPKMTALSETAFVEQVHRHMGRHLGDMKLISKPRSFPLALQLPRSLITRRFALLGDAAHVIHPIAGQGLNLGLRDAAVLAELICDHARLGLDIGADDLLQSYQRQRRFDNFIMAAATDSINRLFGNDVGPLRLLRDLGLGVVERMPFVKNALIGEAAGVTSAGSRLMKGRWP